MPSPTLMARFGFAACALVLGLAGVVMLSLLAVLSSQHSCSSSTSGPAGAASTIALGPPGSGQTVGATEYGGPGDPSSGDTGSSGVNLLEHPDSYAELGGTDFASATAMGGLPMETPLRITWGRHSAIAYKRDIGLGGGPIAGLPRVIDLWWQLAGALGIPYEDGLWSGPVKIERPPAAGSGTVLGADPVSTELATNAGTTNAAATTAAATTAAPAIAGTTTPSGGAGGGAGAAGSGGGALTTQEGSAGGCAAGPIGGVPLTSGPRAVLLPDGQAEAPADAPAAVKGIIAAGNQIVGKPYVYGGGHGVPLNEVAVNYDCSSSVAHLLWGGSLEPVDGDPDSTTLESFGEPGPGRWVTIYASGDHVFMYVAGLRWDTHNAAGPGDGSTGIGWHPLVREDDGFVVRHPAGL